ncbi:MAG: PfkB family carbohydrate kinase [Anaerolineae bacterium]|nr:PfkB family carbohydrate kinase [Anaerolineae bacterium]
MRPGQGRIKVIGIGVACLDYLLLVPRLEEVARGCALRDFRMQGGGMAATAMVTVARLGGEAQLWTALGQDRHGDLIIEELQNEGVDTSQVARLPGLRSPFNFILVDGATGERVFLHPDVDWGRGNVTPGASPALALVDEADALLVDGHWNGWAVPALQHARRAGIPTCGDLNRIAGNENLLPLIDYLIVPRHVAEEVAGEAGVQALESLAVFGAKLVAVTLGSEGVIYLCDRKVYHLPAFSVKVVDTTGAGDVFHGAFTYAIARGWPPHRAMAFSSAVAALKCTQLGGRTGIPTLAQAEEFLESRTA